MHQVRGSTKSTPNQGLDQECTKSGSTEGAPSQGSTEGAPSQGVPPRVHQVRGSTKSAPSQGYHRGCTKSGVPWKVHQVRGSTKSAPSQGYHRGCTKSGVPWKVHQVRSFTEAQGLPRIHWEGNALEERPGRGCVPWVHWGGASTKIALEEGGSTKDLLGKKSTECATGREGPPGVYWEKGPLEG